ncbi:hypothetical protein [Gracilibacillus saliphilus]|nr:hypothetical protein [Gracilibacillus saliphilus]
MASVPFLTYWHSPLIFLATFYDLLATIAGFLATFMIYWQL